MGPGRGVALGVLLLLAGCGGSEAPVAGGPDKTLLSVGISVASLRNPYFVAIARGADAGVRQTNPTAQVITAGDEYSAIRQAAQIDQFVAAHADMILLTPADPVQISDAIGRARAAGIVVVAIDSPAEGADAQVVTDNVAAGTLACAALAERLGGHGQVAMLGGPAAPPVTQRMFGCADALARAPDMHVPAYNAATDGTREGARRAMRDAFGAGQIDAVFAANDLQALGAADAAGELGRTIVIASVEGSPVIEVALTSRARENIVATAAIDPYAMGRAAVRVGTDLRNGRAAKSADRLLDPALVTRETAHDYKGWLAERE